jgi:hypothetical protein
MPVNMRTGIWFVSSDNLNLYKTAIPVLSGRIKSRIINWGFMRSASAIPSVALPAQATSKPSDFSRVESILAEPASSSMIKIFWIINDLL